MKKNTTRKLVLHAAVLILLLSLPPFATISDAQIIPEINPSITTASAISSPPATTTTVYVKLPNFEVIQENGHETVTVIKNTLPAERSGTIIRLTTDDPSELITALKNLNTKKVTLFKSESQLADIFTSEGFDVVIDG